MEYNNQNKELRAFKVFAIENGTVIDHINAGQALTIVRILHLSAKQHIVTIGLNLPSKHLNYKDLIKVEHRELTPEEANRVAIFAPQATINIIRNFEVTKKFNVQIPEIIRSLVVCPNPKCITNNERMDTAFYVKENESEVKLQCMYCEKMFEQNDIREYNV